MTSEQKALVAELMLEHDLCRSEGANDVAYLLDRAAKEIVRLQSVIAWIEGQLQDALDCGEFFVLSHDVHLFHGDLDELVLQRIHAAEQPHATDAATAPRG